MQNSKCKMQNLNLKFIYNYNNSKYLAQLQDGALNYGIWVDNKTPSFLRTGGEGGSM